jgi:putative ABC transport system substrate-binding protein
VRRQLDLIVAHTAPAALAAKHATTRGPSVLGGGGRDPGEAGLVESLARPGGHLTGLPSVGVQLSQKRLALLKVIVPPGSRVAVRWDGANPGHRRQRPAAETAARPRDLTVQSGEVHGTAGVERGFAALTQEHLGARYVAGGPLLDAHRTRIADVALQNRLPSVYERRGAVEDGGRMSSGRRGADMNRRAAVYVDKILKGAQPADLPVEQPMTFELVSTLTTAQALGLTLPPTLRFQADEVLR